MVVQILEPECTLLGDSLANPVDSSGCAQLVVFEAGALCVCEIRKPKCKGRVRYGGERGRACRDWGRVRVAGGIEERDTLREGREGLEDVVEGGERGVLEEMDEVWGRDETDVRAQRRRQCRAHLANLILQRLGRPLIPTCHSHDTKYYIK